MPMNVKEMIYIKGERIIFTLDKFEYDISELIEELEKLKRR